jgi:methylthioribulose-1-phosphate dehydratase
MVSDFYVARRGLCLEGYEMLKGLRGVNSHTYREWIPILENDQDIARLASAVEEILIQYPEAHGFLLRGHGLYSWGENLAEAKRHLEILEFLLEITGRTGFACLVPQS